MKFTEACEIDGCVPIHLDKEATASGSRIGGHPPLNVVPRFESPHQRYFCTFEFSEGWAVSVFYSFDIHGEDEQRDVILHNNRVLYPSNLIQAIAHIVADSSDASKIRTDVSCHRIVLGPVQRDSAEGQPDVPYPHSKLVGSAYVDNVALVGNAVNELAQAGYRQLLQFDTPNPRTAPYVDGFPWDPGWLHLFVRGHDLKDCEFAFIIQQ